MHTRIRCVTSMLALLALPALGRAADNLIGFDAAGSSAELAIEKQLDASIGSADLRGWLKDLAAAPNNVGSPHDRRNAEKMRDMLASWGWNARIETFQVLYPTPLAERVELVAPTQHVAQLMKSDVNERQRQYAEQQRSPVAVGIECQPVYPDLWIFDCAERRVENYG